MENNSIFLDTFNSIEEHLKKLLNLAYNTSFSSMLNRLSKKDEIIKYYQAELNTMRELRNFIVHSDIDQPLVIVSDETLIRIKIIEEALLRPKKIREVFEEKVVALKENDSLKSALKLIKEKRFSQFPVFNEDGFNGLITENGITRWLANNINANTISIKDTCICDVMIDDEEIDSYMYLYAYDTLYDVIRAFESGHKTHRRSFVIIVLKRQSDNVQLEDIYTMLTPWDLSKVYKSLGFRE